MVPSIRTALLTWMHSVAPRTKLARRDRDVHRLRAVGLQTEQLVRHIGVEEGAVVAGTYQKTAPSPTHLIQSPRTETETCEKAGRAIFPRFRHGRSQSITTPALAASIGLMLGVKAEESGAPTMTRCCRDQRSPRRTERRISAVTARVLRSPGESFWPRLHTGKA